LELVRSGTLTLAGNLLFGREPRCFSKSFYVQCAYFNGDDLGATRFLSKDNFYGTIPTPYQQALNFLRSNLRNPQISEAFNEQSELEIPEACFVEVLGNALLHCDYFINATIRVFIFEHRVEIRSPGKLPNSLSIPKIRSGLSIQRNPILKLDRSISLALQ
jgi:ATP-dependent DNA helicase RecG